MSGKTTTPKIEIIRVDSVIEADAVLGRMALEQATLEERSAKVDRAIKIIRERCAPQLQQMKDSIEAKRCALEDWAKMNREQFTGDKKSIELIHGTIGFRTSPPSLKLLYKMTWDRVLGRLTGAREKYVRVKREVDREALLADARKETDPLADAELSQLGVKLCQDETFFANPKSL